MKRPANETTAPRETRRGFLQQTAATAVIIAGGPLLTTTWAQEKGGLAGVGIVFDLDDEIANQEPVKWAGRQLRQAVRAHVHLVEMYGKVAQDTVGLDLVLLTSRTAPAARQILGAAGVSVADTPEAFGLVRGTVDGRTVLLACGSDVRGLVYAVLDLADRVNCAADPLAALRGVDKVVEQPANLIRSVARCFVSDVEDKAWFNDREFWQKYLTMLATQRFNRFSLTLGIGYDFTTGIRDCYFHFAYPFLLSVPGYEVRAVGLPDQERDSNLEMLRFISDEAARRGLHFQLGLWTHAYKWTNSPRANYTIEGLAPETHAAYCRDALRAVLVACPAIQGVTFRIHGESGVAEGSYDFWKTLFDGIVKCGRRVEIDMHAKGMDQPTIDAALATGMPLNISPKYWAEHLGLPYMQAAIRPLEVPAADARDNGFFLKSNGSRKFLRYGYGDLLAEGRRYGVLHRIWPGTQRLLLWGDPVMAAGYGRDFSFCGSAGMEWCEPLSFKGRKGSGLPGGRDAYADESLRTAGGGWEKYLYTYRLWGRLTYNPHAEPETWRRWLNQQFGAGAGPVEAALGSASRILPLITTAHLPSAANNGYWPEIYTNMSIPDERKPHPYSDTMSPKRFGAVSPLDPELFSRMDDFAAELLKGETSGKYSPLEVADWLEELANTAKRRLAQAEAKVSAPTEPEFRRLAVDVAVQSGLGLFFAHKFRAGVLYAVYEGSGHKPAFAESIKEYKAARDAWAELSEKVKGVYAPDITFGYEKQLRGCWPDRLAAIEEDIADMEKRLEAATDELAKAKNIEPKLIEHAMLAVRSRVVRTNGMAEHLPPKSFRRGETIVIDVASGAKGPPGQGEKVRLHYRRVNQAEHWRAAEMQAQGRRYSATIPGDYTDSPFPIQYYFELREGAGNAGLHPGLAADLANQPYYILRQA